MNDGNELSIWQQRTREIDSYTKTEKWQNVLEFSCHVLQNKRWKVNEIMKSSVCSPHHSPPSVSRHVWREVFRPMNSPSGTGDSTRCRCCLGSCLWGGMHVYHPQRLGGQASSDQWILCPCDHWCPQWSACQCAWPQGRVHHMEVAGVCAQHHV